MRTKQFAVTFDCADADRSDHRRSCADVRVPLDARCTDNPALGVDAESERDILKEDRSPFHPRRAADRQPHSVDEDDPRLELGLPMNVRAVEMANHPRRDLRRQREPGSRAEGA